MRILHINYQCKNKTYYYRPGFFSRELAKRGHDVTVMCTSDAARMGFSEYDTQGVHYVETPDMSFGRLRTGWDPWNLLNRVRFLKNISFDLIHAFETRPATIHPVRSLLKRSPAPLVIDWIDWWGRGGLIKEHRPIWYRIFFAWFETFYEEHFRTMANGTTVISRALGKRAESLGVPADTIHWVPNGAQPDLFRVCDPLENRDKYGLPRNALIIADCARDVTLGVELVFRALAIVRKTHPEVLFVMTGEKSKELCRLALREGVADNFRHLGNVPYEQLGEALSCANVFVMPYIDCVANRGRWPGRLSTYFSLGKPVISNKVGEVGYLLAENDVGLIADESPQSFSEQIMRLIGQPELVRKLGVNARRLAENMTWSSVTDRLALCYSQTIDRWKSRQLQ
jgi:glycosyltransferase involved in cell wall biosynthesis